MFSDSQQALLQFYSTPAEYDAVISDQTMLGLTGVEFAQVLRARRPELPIILCTGYSAALNPEVAAQLGVALLVKACLIRSVAGHPRAIALGRAQSQ